MKKLVTKYSYINRERGILCSGLGRFLVTLYTAYLVFFSYLYFNIFRYPNILLSLKEKYLGTSRATLIFVHPTKLSNHNLSCGKYFLLFFLISYFFFVYVIRVRCIKISTSWNTLKYSLCEKKIVILRYSMSYTYFPTPL